MQRIADHIESGGRAVKSSCSNHSMIHSTEIIQSACMVNISPIPKVSVAIITTRKVLDTELLPGTHAPDPDLTRKGELFMCRLPSILKHHPDCARKVVGVINT